MIKKNIFQKIKDALFSHKYCHDDWVEERSKVIQIVMDRSQFDRHIPIDKLIERSFSLNDFHKHLYIMSDMLQVEREMNTQQCILTLEKCSVCGKTRAIVHSREKTTDIPYRYGLAIMNEEFIK